MHVYFAISLSCVRHTYTQSIVIFFTSNIQANSDPLVLLVHHYHNSVHSNVYLLGLNVKNNTSPFNSSFQSILIRITKWFVVERKTKISYKLGNIDRLKTTRFWIRFSFDLFRFISSMFVLLLFVSIRKFTSYVGTMIND